MKIEILFPEFCNLYGDLANMDYLRRCLPQAEFVETSLQEEPLLAREKVDMVYLCWKSCAPCAPGFGS